jgi:mono/diheme cytochrome c family protein
MAGVCPGYHYSSQERIMNRNLRFTVMALLGFSFALPMYAQQPGQVTCNAKCAMCHGPDGAAATPMGRMTEITGQFPGPGDRGLQ